MSDKINGAEKTTVSGSCVISDEVIATIAARAAMEVPDVTGMASRPAKTLRGLVSTGVARSVAVTNHENTIALDVYIHIAVDGRIQEIGTAVQQSVKAAVQAMTGKPVTRVNVHIAGVQLEEKAAQ